MKKTFVYSFLIILIFFSGCEKQTNYKFLKDFSSVDKIELVKISEPQNESSSKFSQCITAIQEITDHDEFLERFTNINCYRIYTDPQGISAGSLAIKIQYDNDDFELIGVNGQAKYTNKIYRQYSGYYYFDNKQFDDLVAYYLSLYYQS